MRRDYREMLEHATELQFHSGYLDTEGLKERGKVESAFKSSANRFVYDLLKELPDAAAASEAVDRDLEALVASPEPPLQAALDEMRTYLMERIARESGKSPWLRTTIRWTPVALGVLALSAYFGLRLYSAVEISQPIASRAGLEQRAAAARKAIRYDREMSGFSLRGNGVKQILWWPLEPTEPEVRAAQEFVSLVLDGHDSLVGQGLPCRTLLINPDGTLSDDQGALVDAVVAHLQDGNVRWREPPAATVIEPIRRHLRC